MQSPIEGHEPQKKVWVDNSRFKVIAAGRRLGKSFLACEALLASSCKKKSLNVYVAPTRAQAKDIVWSHLKNRMGQLKWSATVNESELKITRKNGSKILLRSAEKPDRLRGLGIDFIVFDEVADYRNEEIWTQVVRPALSDRRGRAWFISSPKGFNFFYDIFTDGQTKSDWGVFQYKTIDSPFFQTPEGIKELEEAKSLLSERDYKQEYEAEFLNFTGLIYDRFNRVDCNEDYQYASGNGDIYVSMDFNRSPMSACFFQHFSGRLYQFDEIFFQYSNTEEVCREIKQRYPIQKIVVCPDATGARKTSNSALSDFDIIKNHGFEINCDRINPRRVDRWAAVNRAFEKGLVKINVNRCKNTVRDFERLVYKEGRCEPDLSDPMAGHISDAFGYAVCRFFPIIKKAPSRVSNYR